MKMVSGCLSRFLFCKAEVVLRYRVLHCHDQKTALFLCGPLLYRVILWDLVLFFTVRGKKGNFYEVWYCLCFYLFLTSKFWQIPTLSNFSLITKKSRSYRGNVHARIRNFLVVLKVILGSD